MTPPTVKKGKRHSHTTLASPGLSYFGTHASTSVISGTDSVLNEQAITCLRVEYREDV
jgi:hypothetical protein